MPATRAFADSEGTTSVGGRLEGATSAPLAERRAAIPRPTRLTPGAGRLPTLLGQPGIQETSATTSPEGAAAPQIVAPAPVVTTARVKVIESVPQGKNPLFAATLVGVARPDIDAALKADGRVPVQVDEGGLTDKTGAVRDGDSGGVPWSDSASFSESSSTFEGTLTAVDSTRVLHQITADDDFSDLGSVGPGHSRRRAIGAAVISTVVVGTIALLWPAGEKPESPPAPAPGSTAPAVAAPSAPGAPIDEPSAAAAPVGEPSGTTTNEPAAAAAVTSGAAANAPPEGSPAPGATAAGPTQPEGTAPVAPAAAAAGPPSSATDAQFPDGRAVEKPRTRIKSRRKRAPARLVHEETAAVAEPVGPAAVKGSQARPKSSPPDTDPDGTLPLTAR